MSQGSQSQHSTQPRIDYFKMVNEPLDMLLPFPPSVNTYWRYAQFNNMKTAIPMISKKGREYTKHIEGFVSKYNLFQRFFNGEFLAVELILCPPNNRARDIDNYTKGLFDSFSKAKMWEDDKQIKELKITMGPVTKGGMVRMRVTVMEGCYPKQQAMEFAAF